MTDRAERHIPEIGSAERNRDEERALERGRQLLHVQEGGIRDALDALGEELRDGFRDGRMDDMRLRKAIAFERDYSRALVRYVEECWATAILR